MNSSGWMRKRIMKEFFLKWKRVIAPFVMFFCISFVFMAEEDDLLTIKSSITPKRLAKGQEGKVVLNLTLKKDITISPHPSFTIELNPSDELVFPKNFFTSPDLAIETLEVNGEEYLDLKKTIEIPFTVSLKAKRGNHVLKGKIKYFACSKKEEWYLKTSSKFSATFYTSSRVIKK